MKWCVRRAFDGKGKSSKKQTKSEPYETLNNVKNSDKSFGLHAVHILPLRSLAAVIIALGTLPAFAEEDTKETIDSTKTKKMDILEGFTIGADLVYSHSEAKHNQLVSEFSWRNSGMKPVKNSIPGEIKHKRCNVDPSLNIGYAIFYNNWYIGAAGEISLGSGNKKNSLLHSNKTTGNILTDTKISGVSGGIKIKGGYYLNNLKSVAYGIAGLKWKNINLRLNVDNIFGSKAKLKKPSFAVGVGLERPIKKNLSVSAEWEHTWGNSNDRSDTSNANASTSLHTKQRLSEHDFKIGMKYYI